MSDRQFQRQAAKVAKNDAKKLFQQAIRAGEQVEKEIKSIVNSRPLWARLTIALQIIWRKWK